MISVIGEFRVFAQKAARDHLYVRGNIRK